MALSHAERVFYAEIGAASAAVGTGPILFVENHEYVGAALTLIGIAGIIHSIRGESELPDAAERRSQRNFGIAIALLLLVLIALGYNVFGQFFRGDKPITGTADIPAGQITATIGVPATLPYTVHYKTDWVTMGDNIIRKEDGSFELEFNHPPPQGGGAVDWEIVPRGGIHAIANTVEQLPTATATSTASPWQDFAANGRTGQLFAQQIMQNPIPPPHTADIVATEASHQFASMLVSWLGGANWKLIEHGQPGAYIGEPSEYSLEDGITIRAKASNVDAETLRLAFAVMGIEVHRIILPETEARNYAMIEVGNIPADQR